MAPGLFKINSLSNQKNIIIKKNKFIIFKDIAKHINRNIPKNEYKSIQKKEIKFKTCIFNKIENYKILKNNKLVYNNNIINSENIPNHIINNNANKYIKKFLRSSSYRGVSKNGNKWQVLFMNKNKKYYLGNFNSEEIAAKIYDIFALKYREKKPITNFFYTAEQIKIIKEMKI